MGISCGLFLSNSGLRPFLINRPKILTVVKDPDDPGMRLVVLQESIKSLDDLPANVQEFARSNAAVQVPYHLDLTYDSFSAEQIMKKTLPASCAVSAFETIGHIAHVNLRERQLPYKHIIAQIILDKFSPIKSVVNKVGSISNEFRVFDMEVIGGVDDLNAEVVEHGCRFRFNFREVYWNSRLQTEHLRIAKSFKSGQIIGDLFCGVGPFAIPAASQRSCVIHANDLNPRSVHYLEQNVVLNGLEGKIFPYNLDAREFFRQSRHKQRQGNMPMFDHIVMNLPAMALEFLDVFADQYDGSEKRPRIHVYCFTSAEDKEADILQRAEGFLRLPISDPELHWYVIVFVSAHELLLPLSVANRVRAVAPKKDMYCLSFDLPQNSEERASKRICLNEGGP